jgi:hypothetical protein
MLTYKAMYKFLEHGVHAEVLDFPGAPRRAQLARSSLFCWDLRNPAAAHGQQVGRSTDRYVRSTLWPYR